MLEVPYWEAAENYLGAAPLRPGRHRYRHNEWFYSRCLVSIAKQQYLIML